MDHSGPENAADREAPQRLAEWNALWNGLGIGAAVRRLLTARGLDDSAERVLFALVAKRALAAARWVSEDVSISGLPAITDEARHCAADWLLEIGDALEREVTDRVAGLPDREAEPLFLTLTSACPEADRVGEPPARAHGKPADHGDHPPRAVIAMAVTRDGLPVRAWCWPGNDAAPALIRQVKDDMRDQAPSRIVWVADCGLTSADSLCLREGGHHYIFAEKLRSGSAEAAAALSGEGRYQNVTADLRIKEVRVSDDERFVICHDPGRAEGEAAVRARVTPGGRFRIRAKAVKAEANLDGKYLLRTSDPEMTPEDIALGYNQLLQAKRGWRDMSQATGPRPVCHREEERIRAHVLLCWLALLLTRVAENARRVSLPKPRRTVLVPAQSGAASFAACSRLFRQYPLAAMPHPADGEHRSMVLMNRVAGQAGFFVLTQARDDLFVVCSWSRHDGVHEEIRPGEPIPDSICRVITDGMPIPRDGALLGWVADSEVTAILAVRCGRPASWDATAPVPEIRVMPMAGTSELPHWPPFAASPLDGRLWDYVDRGKIVDIVPLLIRNAGHAFWVPCPDGWSTRRSMGCVVVDDNLLADEFWLPAGVYMDHWTLREGIEAPPVGQLLALPGTVDLARNLW